MPRQGSCAGHKTGNFVEKHFVVLVKNLCVSNFHVMYVAGLGGPEMRRGVRTQTRLPVNAVMPMVFTW